MDPKKNYCKSKTLEGRTKGKTGVKGNGVGQK
jgi:hypothetical protein